MKDLFNKMKKLNENKNGKVITFDFDNTIVKSFENSNDGMEIQYQFGGLNPQIIARIKKFKKEGYTVLVVTSRNVALEVPESSVKTMLKNLDLEVDGIFYTNGQPKAQKLYELGSSLHYDDDPKEHEAIKAYSKLHKDFGISVKYPDELLSDINEIAKGLILTSDGKFIIVQRSDSYEWDSAGGHLMQGEEPIFAFWREVKEEIDLLVKNVEYMDSRMTIWQKQKKLVHYFIGTVDLSSEELDGAIKLQWELADYFCGDLNEIDETMNSSYGSTQNLKNAVSIFLEQGDLLLEIEKYQKKMIKKHSRMKKRVIGLGGSKTTGATGLKRVKNFKRSKSAPPIGEEKDPEKEKKIKISIVDELDEKKKRKKRRKGKKPGPKKGSKRKKRSNKYHWGVGSWWYGSGYGDNSDGGGDGGGGE
jgi:8-oxo-dGTP pyrophosphatase MutT (NUDIX family)